MANNARKLHEMLVRRREADQIKIEKSAAVDKYFDKWNKITSRYEQWTAPEYYQQIDKERHKLATSNQKKLGLELRREILRNQLDEENQQIAMAVSESSTRRRKMVGTDTLDAILESRQGVERENRRHDLEAHLYHDWRLGEKRESILSSAKSNHEALAKLNWFDRQVEMQIDRDNINKASEERQLQIVQQTVKRNELMAKQRDLQSKEMDELRDFQNRHIEELQASEVKSDHLRSMETQLLKAAQELDNEIEIISQIPCRFTESITSHNVRRVKVLLRTMAREARAHVLADQDRIDTLESIWPSSSRHLSLKNEFAMQLDVENQMQSEIEAMYESEAKEFLTAQESVWRQEATLRHDQMLRLARASREEIELQIKNCVDRMASQCELKTAHLCAIEEVNHQLKDMVSQQCHDREELCDHVELLQIDGSHATGDNISHNGRVWPTPQISGETHSELHRPEFGHKKIAWN